MTTRFRVFDMKARAYTGEAREDLDRYLWSLHGRFFNGIHAQVNVYTCRAWSETGLRTRAKDPHWNDTIDDERRMGSIGWSVPEPLKKAVERQLRRGRAVWLFGFDSDADLMFEEVLVSVPS